MAPGGRNNRGSGSTRTSTNGNKSSRTVGNSGINKRRGTKTDLDGDLDMDSGSARRTAAATKGRNANAGRNTRGSAPGRISSNNLDAISKHLAGDDTRPSRRGNNHQNSKTPLVWLRVTGLKESKAITNSDGGIANLLQFMERKASSNAGRSASKPIAIRQHRHIDPHVLVAASADDVEALRSINNLVFAGATLTVEDCPPPDSANSQGKSAFTLELENTLKGILAERYVAEGKLLKLDSLAENQFIKSSGLMANTERAGKLFQSLMKICNDLFKTRSAKQEAIESITIAGNGISNVSQVECLATTFPDLKNLDLSNNLIATMRGIDSWRSKFQKLETLFISGNPLESTASNHIKTLLTWFPKLQNINGNVVRTAEEIRLAEEAARPHPIPQAGTDFRDEHGVAQAFLLDYFALYDTDRDALASKYYDMASTFSLAVDIVGPRDKALPVLSWSPYLRSSRNLKKITTFSGRTQRLFTGSNIIRQLWKNLPRTSHPNITTDLNKFVVDCHPLPGLRDPTGASVVGVDGMIIILHGEFDEQEKDTNNIGKRSFSRTFVLGPGVPGANPIRVVSDMLSLRAYAAVPNVYSTPAAPAAAAAASTATATIPATVSSGVVVPGPAVAAPDQKAILEELCKQTRMVPMYAEMCLSDPNVNWNFEKGLALFNERRGNLPPDAFMA
ncbi:mRNA export factor MEX67 [Ceratocystis fimbriata CBS 114723]|uniref:mRNA export factor MEX67 n=1 Tax=Ceratocystis fimbriata CBS 114723 TaxID=1035309 RepID=A0A2C5X8K0_9PEZI|nr:mRNA export factor MEX67 [Ceratocystis fimbriata CBS 114723]